MDFEKSFDNNNKGAGWKKKSDKGVSYISCQIEVNGKKIYFSMFKNERKEKDSQPDFTILVNDGPKKKEIDPDDIW